MFFSPPTWTSLVLFHEINELQSDPPESNALAYYRCLASDGYRRLRGPVCTSRPIRQDYLDTFVWNEVIRLLDDPGLIQAEIDRRQEAARNADPFRKRQEELRRALIKSSSSEKDAIPPRSPRRCKKGRP